MLTERCPASSRNEVANTRLGPCLPARLNSYPIRPFHPHDDRIISLGLHHNIDTGIAYDVIIDAWCTSL
jgi:hypothetical protein